MQQGRPEPGHGHRAEHPRRGRGRAPGGRAGGRARRRRRSPAAPTAARAPARRRPVSRPAGDRGPERAAAAQQHAHREDRAMRPATSTADVRERPPGPVQRDHRAVVAPRPPPTRPSRRRPAARRARGPAPRGQQRAQRRGRPGHEQRQDGARAGTERDGGREAAHHHPAGPPPGRGEPRHQRRAAVRPGHAGGDGDDGDHRHGRAEPVRGTVRAASSQPARLPSAPSADAAASTRPSPSAPPPAGVTERRRGTVAATGSSPGRCSARTGMTRVGSIVTVGGSAHGSGRSGRPVAEVSGRETGARGTRTAGPAVTGRRALTGRPRRAAAGTAR